jgi:hypothetical protein
MKRQYTWHLPLLLLVASAIGALARTNIADRTGQTTERATACSAKARSDF